MIMFLRAHAESVAASGLKIAIPAISTTAREGLSALPEAAEFIREAPYVVRIQVPANAVVDVNAAMGAARQSGLVYEAEFLVLADTRGAIKHIQPNPVSRLGRATPILRTVGKGLLVIGIGMSAHRIATATPQELPRVIAEESGGWLGGLGGSSLGAALCIGLGIATEGIRLAACGLIGGVAGGLGGSYGGGELGEGLGKRLGEWGPEGTSTINQALTRAVSTPGEWNDYQKARQLGITPF